LDSKLDDEDSATELLLPPDVARPDIRREFLDDLYNRKRGGADPINPKSNMASSSFSPVEQVPTLSSTYRKISWTQPIRPPAAISRNPIYQRPRSLLTQYETTAAATRFMDERRRRTRRRTLQVKRCEGMVTDMYRNSISGLYTSLSRSPPV
jgi:hypothetical protein